MSMKHFCVFPDKVLMQRHLVIFINTADLFMTHRQHLARAAMAKGFRMTVVCPPGPVVARLRDAGFTCRTINLGRKSVNPFSELSSCLELAAVLRELRPDILHSFTIKPVLYGTLVGRWLGTKSIVNTVTGLGFAFIDKGLKAKVLRQFLSLLYLFIFRAPNVQFIFQNQDDRQLYIDQGWVIPERTQVISGTGVDLDVFKPPQNEPALPVKILFAGRFLKDKGLLELVAAAQKLKNDGIDFRLILCGSLDAGNPNSLSQNDLSEIEKLAFVENWGHQTSMAEIYPKCHIVCLPSYREGIPLTLLEGAACGRALVATDVPGCREVVGQPEFGLMVPSREVVGLKVALQTLILDHEIRSRFGSRARTLAEQKFEKSKVVALGLDVYESKKAA